MPGGGAPAYWPSPEVLSAVDEPGHADIGLVLSTPEPERLARFRSASRVLERRAANGPLLVVLDDAHVFDADFRRWLSRRRYCPPSLPAALAALRA